MMQGNTLLYRQVNPRWLQKGQVTSQAFKPTKKDERLLSVYDGDQITPENAWLHFTRNVGSKSAGVVGVSVAERNQLELPVRPDPNLFPEHAVIDFTGLSRGAMERKADALKIFAITRGWLYRPHL